MNFAAPYDTTTKFVSALSCLILLAAGVATHNLIVSAISLTLIFVAYAYSPQGYNVSEGALIVRRLVGDIRMPLSELSELRPATKDDFRGCIRLMGSGGLFGYYGLFRTTSLGKCSWYVTDRSRVVVTRFGAKTILLSPGDGSGFLETVRTLAPQASATPGVSQGYHPGQSGGPAMRLAIALAVALALLGLVVGFLAVR